MKRAGKFVVILLVSVSLNAASIGAETLAVGVYTDYMGDVARITTVDNGRGPLFQYGGNVSVLTDCEKADSMFCVRSPELHLVLPRDGLVKGKSWRNEEVDFDILGRKQISLAGRSFCVWVISGYPSSSGGEGSTFFYSEKFGLVGFTISMADLVIDPSTGEEKMAIVKSSFWLSSHQGAFVYADIAN